MVGKRLIPTLVQNFCSTGNSTTIGRFYSGRNRLLFGSSDRRGGLFYHDSAQVNPQRPSIDSLRRFVTNVSTCAGSDGSIYPGAAGTATAIFPTSGRAVTVCGDTTNIADTLRIFNLSRLLPNHRERITLRKPAGSLFCAPSLSIGRGGRSGYHRGGPAAQGCGGAGLPGGLQGEPRIFDKQQPKMCYQLIGAFIR